MELIRIGDKVISKDKISRMITKILNLRSQGFSQADCARELEVERTFISRLESLGEIYKGERIALVGFPIANRDEIREMAFNLGVEFILLMSEEERWSFVQKEGIDIFNQLMEILVNLKDYDLIIFLGSDMRIDLIDTLLNGKVIGIEIGRSPITEDIYVEVSKLEEMIKQFLK
ncbi:MAG: transcriptional regulator [Halanaerobiales bacterium]|nr:transcriptional regulator [Halanaerobiales bacterium]